MKSFGYILQQEGRTQSRLQTAWRTHAQTDQPLSRLRRAARARQAPVQFLRADGGGALSDLQIVAAVFGTAAVRGGVPGVEGEHQGGRKGAGYLLSDGAEAAG